MNILSVCSEPTVMNVLRLVVLFINIIKVAVPIVLIVSVMIKFASAVTKNDDNLLNKATKSIVPSVIAAVLIFLVPTLIDLVVRVSFPKSDYAKCVSGITIEDVKNAYNSRMDTLIANVESSLEYTDYSAAIAYLPNIKDNDRKKEYEDKLSAIKALIDEKMEQKKPKPHVSDYAKVNYSNFKWTKYKYETGPLLDYYDWPTTYLIYGPEDVSDLHGVSLPLIVWLHGIGEVGLSGDILGRGLFKAVNNWDKYDLDPIPAIIVAPQSPQNGWDTTRNIATIKALISYAKDHYKVDGNNITLMGHSMGGYGAIAISAKMQEYYSALVIMSGGAQQSVGNNAEYFSKIKMRGYAESDSYKNFFTSAKREDDFILYKGVAHGDIPEEVMKDDANKDGVSDLMYWLYEEKAFTREKSTDNQSDDNNNGNNNSGDNSSGSGSGSNDTYVPVANPITNYVNVSSLNSKLASTVKSNGLYTRNAVVSVATTLVSELEASNYYIPYQMGGMYHRGNLWGVNPEWGTVIDHNGKKVLSGLDCRNFVIWTFKQAGLSLKRGLMYGGEAMVSQLGDNKYSDISMGKPGDTIDSLGHLMLIVRNNGSSYTVAESNGVGRVRIFDWTYDKIRADGYSVYNMDAIYNNTAALCPTTSYDRPYSGSCRIPKSEFPAYYGF